MSTPTTEAAVEILLKRADLIIKGVKREKKEGGALLKISPKVKKPTISAELADEVFSVNGKLEEGEKKLRKEITEIDQVISTIIKMEAQLTSERKSHPPEFKELRTQLLNIKKDYFDLEKELFGRKIENAETSGLSPQDRGKIYYYMMRDSAMRGNNQEIRTIFRGEGKFLLGDEITQKHTFTTYFSLEDINDVFLTHVKIDNNMLWDVLTFGIAANAAVFSNDLANSLRTSYDKIDKLLINTMSQLSADKPPEGMKEYEKCFEEFVNHFDGRIKQIVAAESERISQLTKSLDETTAKIDNLENALTTLRTQRDAKFKESKPSGVDIAYAATLIQSMGGLEQEISELKSKRDALQKDITSESQALKKLNQEISRYENKKNEMHIQSPGVGRPLDEVRQSSSASAAATQGVAQQPTSMAASAAASAASSVSGAAPKAQGPIGWGSERTKSKWGSSSRVASLNSSSELGRSDSIGSELNAAKPSSNPPSPIPARVQIGSRTSFTSGSSSSPVTERRGPSTLSSGSTSTSPLSSESSSQDATPEPLRRGPSGS